MGKLLFGLVVVVAFGAALGAWWMHTGHTSTTTLETAPVDRGDVLAEINATGTVEPEEVVDVGAQVAGQVDSFGTDIHGKPIDYGSVVNKGTILAQIDNSLYAAAVTAAQAGLASAQAAEQQAVAKLSEATQDWTRAQKLGPSDALAATAFDQYKATFEIAQADLAAAQASVKQAQASLDAARLNLGYCTITSPVQGVIIDRRVNIGQTVVSSLNAPSLFLIAKDLTKMQVWVGVNEADIGQIHAGVPVKFTCDAFPGREFDGVVGKVRLNANMTQNVVMYTVEVNTDNSNNVLLPYLTANVHFILKQAKNVLEVPNAALAWLPSSLDEVAPDARSWKPIEQRAGDGSGSSEKAEKRGTVWIKEGALVRPVDVSVGISDGSQTAVTSDQLAVGQEVVVSEQGQSAQSESESPFVPKIRRH
ncbi:MAG: efflux RND transporter periplasmic adaptor subunit [Planctomycetota bacterium]